MPTSSLRSSRSVLAALALGAVLFAHAPVSAQCADGTDHLIRMLAESDAFRVRVLSANALGSRTPCGPITSALIAALRDSEASVRAAAAASLSRVGDSSALSALRGMSSDRESAVREAATDAIAAIEARGGGGSSGGGSSGGGSGSSGGSSGGGSGSDSFYVGVGPGAGISGSALSAARTFFRGRVDATTGVALAPDGEADSAANRVLSSRHLSGFFLDWTISLTDTSAGLRVRAEIVIQTYPGRDIIAMANSSSVMAGDHDESHAGPYIEAVLSSALRQASGQFR